MRQFIRMYEPHAAREDTVLFPAFAELVSEKELPVADGDLRAEGEGAPARRLREDGLPTSRRIEKAFGIDDLARFTPKPPTH